MDSFFAAEETTSGCSLHLSVAMCFRLSFNEQVGVEGFYVVGGLVLVGEVIILIAAITGYKKPKSDKREEPLLHGELTPATIPLLTSPSMGHSKPVEPSRFASPDYNESVNTQPMSSSQQGVSNYGQAYSQLRYNS